MGCGIILSSVGLVIGRRNGRRSRERRWRRRGRDGARKSQAQGGPDRIVVIGDTEHDIRCARAVGAYAVAAPTGHTPSEVLAKENPDLLVNTLEDHAAILAYLAA